MIYKIIAIIGLAIVLVGFYGGTVFLCKSADAWPVSHRVELQSAALVCYLFMALGFVALIITLIIKVIFNG